MKITTYNPDGSIKEVRVLEKKVINESVIGKRVVVCDITLEDYIEFQQIEFKVIRGYYWNEGKDYTIQEKIKYLFEQRDKYKKQENPLQALYKLIMNSCYGKTIQKPIETNKVFKYDGTDEYNKYLWHNFDSIVEDIEVGEKIHCIKVRNHLISSRISVFWEFMC